MNRTEIVAWVTEKRAIAKLQMERWSSVDPSRLVEACDIIEQLLAELQPATQPAPGLQYPAKTKMTEIPLAITTWNIRYLNGPGQAPIVIDLSGTIDYPTLAEQERSSHLLYGWVPNLRIMER